MKPSNMEIALVFRCGALCRAYLLNMITKIMQIIAAGWLLCVQTANSHMQTERNGLPGCFPDPDIVRQMRSQIQRSHSH